MKPILIVKTGSTFADLAERHGDFERWFVDRLDPELGPVAVAAPFLGEPLPAVESLAGIVVTGSHDMVTDGHLWSETTARWLRTATATALPVLGVCYGHQLLAYALGGVVGDNPAGKQFGTVTIQLTAEGRADRLLAGLPDTFAVQACHSQRVLHLPPDAVRLAASSMDPNHIFAWGKTAWGLQFHPEFNGAVMGDYIRRFSDDLRRQGQNPEQLLTRLSPTPEGESLLVRFQRICRQAAV